VSEAEIKTVDELKRRLGALIVKLEDPAETPTPSAEGSEQRIHAAADRIRNL
jgi:hypothetical protein